MVPSGRPRPTALQAGEWHCGVCTFLLLACNQASGAGCICNELPACAASEAVARGATLSCCACSQLQGANVLT